MQKYFCQTGRGVVRPSGGFPQRDKPFLLVTGSGV